MSAQAKRRGPAPGVKRPQSYRLALSAEELRMARLLKAHTGRPFAAILRDSLAREFKSLGLDAGNRRRPA